MSAWIVAQRAPDGAWDVLPRVVEEHEALEYAAHLAPDVRAVGLNLDSLPPLPVLDESPPSDRVERVRRPDGSMWTYQPRWGRRVHREDTPAGPVVLVLRTHRRSIARRMAEVRWNAFYPDQPMPAGELEWRRLEANAAVPYASREAVYRVGPSTGAETRSFPVVAFRPVSEESST